MPDFGTRIENYTGTPGTYRVAPSTTIPVRCFATQIGVCREVVFSAFSENTNIITIGDTSGNATSGNEQGIALKPGAVLVANWIDPYDWYVATQGDSTHGVAVTVTK